MACVKLMLMVGPRCKVSKSAISYSLIFDLIWAVSSLLSAEQSSKGGGGVAYETASLSAMIKSPPDSNTPSREDIYWEGILNPISSCIECYLCLSYPSNNSCKMSCISLWIARSEWYSMYDIWNIHRVSIAWLVTLALLPVLLDLYGCFWISIRRGQINSFRSNSAQCTCLEKRGKKEGEEKRNRRGFWEKQQRHISAGFSTVAVKVDWYILGERDTVQWWWRHSWISRYWKE